MLQVAEYCGVEKKSLTLKIGLMKIYRILSVYVHAVSQVIDHPEYDPASMSTSS